MDEARLRRFLQTKASTVDLSPGAWERVQAALPAKSARRRFAFPRWLLGGLEAAVAVILIGVMAATVFHPKTGMPAGLVSQEAPLKQRPEAPANLPWDAYALRSRIAVKRSQALYQEMLRLLGLSDFCLNPPVPGTNTEGGYLLYKGADSWPDLELLSASQSSSGAYLLTMRNTKGLYLLDGSNVREWPYSGPAAATEPGPVYLGDELVSVRWNSGTKTYGVYLGERQAYELNAPSRFGALTAWNGHWVLEADDQVIMDGKPVGAGYDAVFGWQVLNGKPFYLWQRGVTYGISYDGEERRLAYDEILRTKGLEPAGDGETVTFLARKEAAWEAVTITHE